MKTFFMKVRRSVIAYFEKRKMKKETKRFYPSLYQAVGFTCLLLILITSCSKPATTVTTPDTPVIHKTRGSRGIANKNGTVANLMETQKIVDAQTTLDYWIVNNADPIAPGHTRWEFLSPTGLQTITNAKLLCLPIAITCSGTNWYADGEPIAPK